MEPNQEQRNNSGSADLLRPLTDGVLRLEDLLVVFRVVDLSRRHFLVRLVLAWAPPLTFWAPPISVSTLLHPDDITTTV